MLRTYVVEGKVDYARWQKESAEALDQWLDSVRSADFDSMDRESMIAYLLNLYNALVIRQVLQKYPIDSIRPEVLGVPNWASFLVFFKRPIYKLGDRSLSLDNIEHDILRDRYNEPRIHFALVCAATSCPLLRAEAYTPNRVLDQLEADARRFIQNSTKVSYDAASNTLYCSKIFQWYEKDFVAQAGSITSYIQTYLPETTIPTNTSIAYLPYSWQLNDQRTFL